MGRQTHTPFVWYDYEGYRWEFREIGFPTEELIRKNIDIYKYLREVTLPDTYCGKGLGGAIDYDVTLQKVRSRVVKNNPLYMEPSKQ